MAFTKQTFSHLGGSAYVYKTDDSLSTVDDVGYFNALAPTLKVGDFIFAYSTTGPSAGVMVVQSNTRDITATEKVAGVVDTFNKTAMNTTIDSD